MPYIHILGSGKSQIRKNIAFVTLLNGSLPKSDTLFSKLFSEFDELIIKRDKTIKSGALSNVHGDWYEWLLAIQAWNNFVKEPNSNLALLLPNISRFDVARLYDYELNSLIEDLRDKVQSTSEVQLITSNPDFVIIDGTIARSFFSELELIDVVNIDTLLFLESLYTKFIAKCSFEKIIGYISVKTSFRPDRRLQISHEGSLMKAIYTHLQTRKWIINPPGLKYYAMATSVGTPDREALKTVATHSITTVSSLPQAAVDDVFEVNTLFQAQAVFAEILRS